MHHPTDRIAHTTAFVTPVVEHWLEQEIAQWVHPIIVNKMNCYYYYQYYYMFFLFVSLFVVVFFSIKISNLIVSVTSICLVLHFKKIILSKTCILYCLIN